MRPLGSPPQATLHAARSSSAAVSTVAGRQNPPPAFSRSAPGWAQRPALVSTRARTPPLSQPPPGGPLLWALVSLLRLPGSGSQARALCSSPYLLPRPAGFGSPPCLCTSSSVPAPQIPHESPALWSCWHRCLEDPSPTQTREDRAASWVVPCSWGPCCPRNRAAPFPLSRVPALRSHLCPWAVLGLL